jgi:hypothetical protein
LGAVYEQFHPGLTGENDEPLGAAT